MVLLQRKLYFSKDPEGVQHFQGVQLLPGGGGGVQTLISIETHITCEFPEGSSFPISPSRSAHGLYKLHANHTSISSSDRTQLNR